MQKALKNPPVYKTNKDMCARYGVSHATWWRITKTPGFPSPLRIGRSVRWNPELTDAFLIQSEA